MSGKIYSTYHLFKSLSSPQLKRSLPLPRTKLPLPNYSPETASSSVSLPQGRSLTEALLNLLFSSFSATPRSAAASVAAVAMVAPGPRVQRVAQDAMGSADRPDPPDRDSMGRPALPDRPARSDCLASRFVALGFESVSGRRFFANYQKICFISAGDELSSGFGLWALLAYCVPRLSLILLQRQCCLLKTPNNYQRLRQSTKAQKV